MSAGRARHLSRRIGVRRTIPSSVFIPKFMTTSEIAQAIEEKAKLPKRTWTNIIADILYRSRSLDDSISPKQSDQN